MHPSRKLLQWCAAAGWAAFLFVNTASASSPLELKNANNNSNRMENGELVSTLTGDVVFIYEDLTVKADNARWWRRQGTIKLWKHCRTEKPNLVMTCDEMTFYREKNGLFLHGNVVIDEAKNRVHVIGDDGRYDLKTKLFTLNRDPVFMKFDTAAAETLVIVGKRMSYSDSLNVASAEQNVRITKGRLVSTCETSRYDTKQGLAHLRSGPPIITYNAHSVTGDSIDLVFGGDTLKGVSVQGHSHGRYHESDTTDTTVTHVWSDSMYLSITPGGRLDTIRAFRNVKSTYHLAESGGMANEVTGRTMVLGFNDRGDIASARVYGNATSIYFVKNEDGRGRNESSGDTIRVWFSAGRASRLLLAGAVRGVYFPLQE
jgi:lipopolysaccharide export system protein LptA